MRRTLSPVLIGLGVFLIVLAVLMPAYAYSALARVPTNYDSTTYLSGKGVTVFNTDPKVLAPQTTDLNVTSHSVATAVDKGAPKDTVVWGTAQSVVKGDGVVFQRSVERAAFNAKTGAAVNCCGNFVESDEGQQTPVTRTGQVYKFPFGTEKKTYNFWDGTVGQAVEAKYVGTSKINGKSLYTFSQTIPSTEVGQVVVPGTVFNAAEPSARAAMMYAMKRTFYVEPNTGMVIKRVDDRNQVLSYGGQQIPAFVGKLTYTDKSVQDALDYVSWRGPLLGALKLTLPIIAGLLGILCIVGGWHIGRRQRAVTRTAAGAPEPSVA